MPFPALASFLIYENAPFTALECTTSSAHRASLRARLAAAASGAAAFPSRTQVASTTIAATEAASRRPFANLERRGQQGPMDGRQKAQAEMAAYREEMERARAAEEEQHLMEKARNMAGLPPPQLSYRIA